MKAKHHQRSLSEQEIRLILPKLSVLAIVSENSWIAERRLILFSTKSARLQLPQT
jgi:hypothetical protein